MSQASLADSPLVSAMADARARRDWRVIDLLLLAATLAISIVVMARNVQPNASFDELSDLMLSASRGHSIGVFQPDVIYESPPRLTSLDGAPSIWRIWTTLDGMPHPPFYFLALRVWREIFGESTPVAHAFSITCASVAVLFTFVSARLAMNVGVAALAGLALGCSQTQVYLAQEIRPYALATAIGACAIYLMTRIEVRGGTRRTATALAALTLPMMLTNYFSLGACVGIAIYGLIRLRGHRRAFVFTLVTAAAIFAIAWLPFLLRQARDVGPAAGFLRADHLDLVNELGLLACAPFRLIADRDYYLEKLTLLSGAVFVVPWLLARRLPTLLPWAALACGAIVFVFFVDIAALRSHLTVVRYFAIAAPAVILAFVGCAWAIDRRLSYVTGATLLATGAIYLASGNIIVGECPDFGGTVRLLETKAKPGDAILCYNGGAPRYYSDMFALSASDSPTLFPRPLMILTQPLTDSLRTQLPRRAWLMTGALDRSLKELFPDARVLSKTVANVDVTLFELDLNPSSTAVPAIPGGSTP